MKRKDITQEQRSAQTMAKRAARMSKKKESTKAADKQPAQGTQGEVDAAAEAEKQRALSLNNTPLTYMRPLNKMIIDSRYDSIYQDGLTA